MKLTANKALVKNMFLLKKNAKDLSSIYALPNEIQYLRNIIIKLWTKRNGMQKSLFIKVFWIRHAFEVERDSL